MINKNAVDLSVSEFKTETKSFEKLNEKTVEGLKQTATAATAGLDQAQAKMKENMDRAVKTAEQMAHFSQGNVEAFMKSSQILAAGFQDMSKLLAAQAKASLDETMATFRAMSGVKSVKEAMDMQAAYARTSMEKAMAESGKLTEHSLKLAEQAMAPITARVNAAVETFGTNS